MESADEIYFTFLPYFVYVLHFWCVLQEEKLLFFCWKKKTQANFVKWNVISNAIKYTFALDEG